ncbi:MAG: hypothetical protein AAFR38_05250 [Planctomycetota bacterium]
MKWFAALYRTLGTVRWLIVTAAMFLLIAIVAVEPGPGSASVVGANLPRLPKTLISFEENPWSPSPHGVIKLWRDEYGGWDYRWEDRWAWRHKRDPFDPSGKPHAYVVWDNLEERSGFWAATRRVRDPICFRPDEMAVTEHDRAKIVEVIFLGLLMQEIRWPVADPHRFRELALSGRESTPIPRGWLLNALSAIAFSVMLCSMVAFMATVPGRLRIMFRRRSMLLARGLCPSCKYDISGITDRCPECGGSLGA